jgi:ubiquinone/menaquinone biosynthesis C-methylase UbiE
MLHTLFPSHRRTPLATKVAFRESLPTPAARLHSTGHAGLVKERRMLEVKHTGSRVPAVYSRIARGYELWARLTESRARARVLELAAVRDGEDVLDVATGTGVQLVALARLNPSGRTVGVELADGMVRQTRRRLAATGLRRVELHRADARALPFPDASFDLLTNGYMLDLLPTADIATALREFRRVLRPGGRLVLSNMTPGEKPTHRLWDALYARGIVLTANCRGVLAAPVLLDLGFDEIQREYLAQLTFPTEIIIARRPTHALATLMPTRATGNLAA